MGYTIVQEPFGLKIAIEGMLGLEAAQAYAKEYQEKLAKYPGAVGLFLDLRRAGVMVPQAQGVLEAVFDAVRRRGLTRVATIVPNVIVKMQLTRMAREHEFRVNERFIDASLQPNWEALAVAWVSAGVEPDAP